MRKIGFALFFAAAVIVGLFLLWAPPYVDSQFNAVVPHDPYEVSETAQSLHNDLIIGDWHSDSLLWKRSILRRHSFGHVDLPRLLDGNVTIQVFSAVTKSPAGQNYDQNSADASDRITLLVIGQLWPIRTWGSLFERAHYQAERLHQYSAQSNGQLVVITDRDGLDAVLAQKAAGANVVGGLLALEGAHPLEGNITNLAQLYDAGYRVIGLQHFFDNELGGSLHGIGNRGLTDFGRDVVSQAQAMNMIVDLAHSSPAVVEDVLAITSAPVIVSHTGLHSHCQTPRNISDALMRRVAATGGLIAIGFWADVTCDDSPLGVAKTIMATVRVVGADHVSLGSDFDGSVRTGLDTSELAALTDALLTLGADEVTIRKIMGENMISLLRSSLP